MVKAHKYVVKRKFNGPPRRDDYVIVEDELPPLADREILVKAEWISVDPYLRIVNRAMPTPYDQFGCQVAVVKESKHPQYPVGTTVVSHLGWRDYSIIRPDAESPYAVNAVYKNMERLYKVPDLKGLPKSLAVGAVGMPGATAYFGFLDGCKPQAGETVVVTGAAGAVGSIAGQIAKIKGCRVIGFAGSDAKVQWLEKDLGFDKAFNYKTVNVETALKEAAPNGVDCYFDNVGGEISSTIIHHMNALGRVAVCGGITGYNADSRDKVSSVQQDLIEKQLNIKGVVGWAHGEQWPEAFAEIVEWIKSGKLKAREHVTVGFKNIFDAFTGMLEGENFGKAVVKV